MKKRNAILLLGASIVCLVIVGLMDLQISRYASANSVTMEEVLGGNLMMSLNWFLVLVLGLMVGFGAVYCVRLSRRESREKKERKGDYSTPFGGKSYH
jgi:hypothetical protein